MALPSSGQIKLSEIAAEHGGDAPHSMSEYHGEGNAPESGEIRLAADFYGTAAVPTINMSHIGSNGTLSIGVCHPGGYFSPVANSEIIGYKTDPSSISGNLSSYFEDVLIGQDYTYGVGHFLILVYKNGLSGAGAGLSTITLTRADGGYTNSSSIVDNRGVYGNWNSSPTGRLALFSEVDAKPGVVSWYNSLVYNQTGSSGNTSPLTVTLT